MGRRDARQWLRLGANAAEDVPRLAVASLPCHCGQVELAQVRTQTCTVVTRGRRTGAEHVARVWFTIIDAHFYAASRRGLRGDWLQNALHDGSLEVRAMGSSWRGPVSLLAAEHVSRVVEAFAEKYHRYAEVIAAWRQDSPTFVEVDLRGSNAAV